MNGMGEFFQESPVQSNSTCGMWEKAEVCWLGQFLGRESSLVRWFVLDQNALSLVLPIIIFSLCTFGSFAAFVGPQMRQTKLCFILISLVRRPDA